ncbi:MAG TPA: protein phosphatase 2C domain-containing protein [Clostridia bacterium]|nr:protein phosphatase 2C domain-containing protein [Clostridia bacterium]
MTILIDTDASVVTDKGLIRLNNEDNFYLNGSYMHEEEMNNGIRLSKQEKCKAFIYAVCDGMGGEEAGEKASFTAVSELKKFHDGVFSNASIHDGKSLVTLVNTYIRNVNSLINDISEQNCFSLGTTFASLILFNNLAIALNLGDSRVYLFRDGNLNRLTADHTEAERLVRLGAITREQALKHKSRHMLYRYLGTSPDSGHPEAEASEAVEILKGDAFLLCSDGLTDMVDENRIAEILSADSTSMGISDALAGEAIKNGGADNVTVMTIKIQGLG